MGEINAFFQTLSKPLRLFIFFFLGLVLAFILLTFFAYFNGLENVLSWNIATELHKKSGLSLALQSQGLQIFNNEWVYYLKSWYISSGFALNTWPSMALLIASVSGLSLALAALNQEKSLWFLASALLLGGFLLSIRLEIAFQNTSNWPFLCCFGLIGGLMYAIQTLRNKSSVMLRWVLFLMAFVSVFGAALFLRKVEAPLYASMQYGLVFPLIIFAAFVFLIAHEGLAAVVWLATKDSISKKNNLKNFLILSGFLFINYLLILLENLRLIDESFFVISPIWLLLFSSILGLWGFKKQMDTLRIFSSTLSAPLLYLAMALVSFAFLAYALLTGNDPLYELLLDYIIFAHLAVSLVFFAHVLINFINLFRQGFRVDLVLYKPQFSRLILAKIAALFCLAFLLIQKNIYSFNQWMAGWNNAKGDYYRYIGENTPAETFYTESVRYDYYNHKANYALAEMAREVGDGTTAAYYFKRALQKNPSPYAYVALSEHLETEGLYFEALFNLREAVQHFPKNEALHTNTAHILEKARAIDSVYIYLHQALELCADCEIADANMLAFWIENGKLDKLDSLSASFKQSTERTVEANKLAINRLIQKQEKASLPMYTGTQPNSAEFADLYNRLLSSQEETYPDTLWAKLVENLVPVELNQDALFLKAQQNYQQGQKLSAITQMSYLAADSTEEGLFYRRNLAILFLKENLYSQAVRYLKLSGDSLSAETLKQNGFDELLLARQKQEAAELEQHQLSLENYEKLLAKAPFNAFWVLKVADFLEKKNEVNKAYLAVFNALQFNDNTAKLWEKFVLLAYMNGVPDYAENGLDKLRELSSPQDFRSFESQVQILRKEQEEAVPF
ncbi:hypothetical protein LAG90_11065 [Marinilongibacter aquaticus]|uniref:hypothetical protein n=1 Tax=Marinilongibacter aquaticus TaxID=2975157 RepID=UPI0021BD92AB|nr:hypothetical protein [Marinilongibacter aquaticus]UBM57359.1 hypothetical protein LAG90_11065 [Marinilongibacter aquaticus]